MADDFSPASSFLRGRRIEGDAGHSRAGGGRILAFPALFAPKPSSAPSRRTKLTRQKNPVRSKADPHRRSGCPLGRCPDRCGNRHSFRRAHHRHSDKSDRLESSVAGARRSDEAFRRRLAVRRRCAFRLSGRRLGLVCRERCGCVNPPRSRVEPRRVLWRFRTTECYWQTVVPKVHDVASGS